MIKCQETCKKILLGTDQPNPSPTPLATIKLVSVPSLIPIKTFAKIRDILITLALQQISEEFNDAQRKSNIFEQEFLKSNGLEELRFAKTLMGDDLNLKDFPEKFQQRFPTFQKLKDSWNNGCKSNFPDLNKFVELVQDKFYIIEPIAVVVLKIISPLAEGRSQLLEDIVVRGWQQFATIFTDKNQSESSGANSNLLTGLKENNLNYDNIEELAKQAFYKVIQLIVWEIKLIVCEQNYSENPKIEDYQRTIFFCFFLKKCLNSLKFSFTQEQQGKIAQSLEPNIFDKQELIEIEEPSTDDKLELFPTLKLSIPISNTFLQQFITSSEPDSSKDDSCGESKPQNPHAKLYFYLPNVVDLSFWCSKVEDQGSLNSCAAFAGIALLEYFANRSAVDYQDASALFLYKVARNKMNVTGDVGASIRETMKAMALFGIPPEETWPYEEDKVDEEPPPFCYSYAHNYRALKYFRLDYAGIPRESLLFQIKAVLAAGFPCMFGFTIYTSAYEASNTEKGYIPFPDVKKDKVVGGHAVVAVGYDDYKNIESADRQQMSKGAFLIRNSWGSDWGINGYGWLPYDYVLYGLTAAWWSLLKSEWFEEGNFGLGARSGEGIATITKPGSSSSRGG